MKNTDTAERKGYDAGKKVSGIKRHLAVEQPQLFKKCVYNMAGLDIQEARLIPGKADWEAQERFLKAYDEIEKNKGKDDPIYFMDATHPQHNQEVFYQQKQ